jgi:hypothetical protein
MTVDGKRADATTEVVSAAEGAALVKHAHDRHRTITHSAPAAGRVMKQNEFQRTVLQVAGFPLPVARPSAPAPVPATAPRRPRCRRRRTVADRCGRHIEARKSPHPCRRRSCWPMIWLICVIPPVIAAGNGEPQKALDVRCHTRAAKSDADARVTNTEVDHGKLEHAGDEDTPGEIQAVARGSAPLHHA